MKSSKFFEHIKKIKTGHTCEFSRKSLREEKFKSRKSQRSNLLEKGRNKLKDFHLDDHLLRENYYNVEKFLNTLDQVQNNCEDILLLSDTFQKGFWLLNDERRENISHFYSFANEIISNDIFILSSPCKTYPSIGFLFRSNIFFFIAVILNKFTKSNVLKLIEGQTLFSTLISFISIFSSMVVNEQLPVDKDFLIFYSFVNLLKLPSLNDQSIIANIFFYLGNLMKASSHFIKVLFDLKFHDILAIKTNKVVSVVNFEHSNLRRYLSALSWVTFNYFLALDWLDSTHDFNVIESLVQDMIKLLQFPFSFSISFILKSLYFLSPPTSHFYELIIGSEFLITTLGNLCSQNCTLEIIKPSISLLVNITANGGRNISIFIKNFKILESLKVIAAYNDADLEHKIFEILRNLTAEGSEEIQTIIDYNLVQMITDGISMGSYATSKAGIMLIKNICEKGTIEQLMIFIDSQVINAFLSVLQSDLIEPFRMVLEICETIFEKSYKYNLYELMISKFNSTNILSLLKHSLSKFSDNIINEKIFQMVKILESNDHSDLDMT